MSGNAPAGYHDVTPYIAVRGAAEAIAFYVAVFGATETARITGDDGRIGHAEVTIGDSPMMLADEHPEIDVLGPLSRGGTTVTLHLFVADADATVAIGNVGANGRVDSHTVQQPIASFVLTNVGLEAGVSVGGGMLMRIAVPRVFGVNSAL